MCILRVNMIFSLYFYSFNYLLMAAATAATTTTIFNHVLLFAFIPVETLNSRLITFLTINSQYNENLFYSANIIQSVDRVIHFIRWNMPQHWSDWFVNWKTEKLKRKKSTMHTIKTLFDHCHVHVNFILIVEFIQKLSSSIYFYDFQWKLVDSNGDILLILTLTLGSDCLSCIKVKWTEALATAYELVFHCIKFNESLIFTLFFLFKFDAHFYRCNLFKKNVVP